MRNRLTAVVALTALLGLTACGATPPSPTARSRCG